MTPKQKRLVIAFAFGDLLVISAVAFLWLRSIHGLAGQRPFSPEAANDTSAAVVTAHSAPSPMTQPGRCSAQESTAERECAWQAVQWLTQARLAGTADFSLCETGRVLRFRLVCPPTESASADTAAQAVWTAFDIAWALCRLEQCARFERIEVLVRASDGREEVRIKASVPAEDLVTYYMGHLSEEAFIERVAYSVSR